ncbi:MAG: response regulator [Prochlorotrichaceae cyanobacterium]|jgi:twitching motility two-component system response regulator PilH
MKTVMIVEDTSSELELLSQYVRNAGYTVVTATNAEEALQKADSQSFDAVVTDLVMPGMNGYELCRTLKENPKTAKVPVMVCSSKNQEIDRLWAMKQGATQYIAKPFTEEQLLQSLKTLV